ncbi:MAG: glycosyltransferase [Bacteroidota bacterium]|nr:glycosyltransferase [Bacteroidota bacterium]
MVNPKLSIITVNYNNLAGLQKTMESVSAQAFTDFEYIVVDGGSADGSKAYIEEHAGKLSYWASEKDEGIYHAMNKGIAKANGEYLLFLNSGDYFYTPESISKLFEHSHHEDIIYGILMVNEEDGKQWILDYPSELSFGYFYRHSLPHQSTLINADLFKTIGLYNEKLKIAADWEFFMKAICMHNATYKYVNEIITVFSMGGVSTNPVFTESSLNERHQILNSQYGLYINEYLEYLQIKAELYNYKNSRAHKLVEKIIQSSLYRKMRKQ